MRDKSAHLRHGNLILDFELDFCSDFVRELGLILAQAFSELLLPQGCFLQTLTQFIRQLVILGNKGHHK